MEEAIGKFQKESITVTERSIPMDRVHNSPAILICPNPAFKPSVYDLHGFRYPARDLFNMRTPFSEKFKDLYNHTTVRSLFEAFSYTNDDLEFKAFGRTLNEGDNLVKFKIRNWTMNFELKKVITAYYGVCHVIQQNSTREYGSITVQYKKTLSVSDAPKSFLIHFVERDEWQGKNIYPNFLPKLLSSQSVINN